MVFLSTATRLRIRTPRTKISCSYTNPYTNRLLSYAHTFFTLFSQHKTKAHPYRDWQICIALYYGWVVDWIVAATQYIGKISSLPRIRSPPFPQRFVYSRNIPYYFINWTPYPYLTSHLCEVTSSTPLSHRTNLQKVSGWLASCQARLCSQVTPSPGIISLL